VLIPCFPHSFSQQFQSSFCCLGRMTILVLLAIASTPTGGLTSNVHWQSVSYHFYHRNINTLSEVLRYEKDTPQASPSFYFQCSFYVPGLICPAHICDVMGVLQCPVSRVWHYIAQFLVPPISLSRHHILYRRLRLSRGRFGSRVLYSTNSPYSVRKALRRQP